MKTNWLREILKRVLSFLFLVLYIFASSGSSIVQISHYCSHMFSHSLYLHENYNVTSNAQKPVHQHSPIVDLLLIKGDDLFEKHSVHVLPGVNLFDHKIPERYSHSYPLSDRFKYLVPWKISRAPQHFHIPLSPPPQG